MNVSYVEFTDELKMSGMLQVCLLHRSDTREVRQFEEFISKSDGPRKPGFYKASGGVYLREYFRKGKDGKYWTAVVPTPSGYEFVSASNPLQAAQVVAPVAAVKKAA